MAIDGLIVLRSAFDHAETAARLEQALQAKGIMLLARIDHAAAARQAGQELRPTLLLVFGNPKVGTALMQAAQTMGIDLPLKALVWEDEGGAVWLGYDDPARAARRHGLGTEVTPTLQAMTTGLQALAKEATGAA